MLLKTEFLKFKPVKNCCFNYKIFLSQNTSKMKIYKYLYFIIPLLFAVSCSSSRYVAKNVSTTCEIQDIVLLNLESSISLIEKGDNAVFSDSMSTASKKMLTQIALSEPTKIPVVACEEYSEQDVRLLDEFFVSFLKMDKSNYEYAAIPQQVDSLIEKTGHRYGMMLYATGFKRTKANVRKMMAKYLLIDLAVGIVTLGTVIPYAYPVEYNSTLYTMVVDSQENRVIFVNHCNMDIDPFEEIDVRDQMLELFYDFTWQ